MLTLFRTVHKYLSILPILTREQTTYILIFQKPYKTPPLPLKTMYQHWYKQHKNDNTKFHIGPYNMSEHHIYQFFTNFYLEEQKTKFFLLFIHNN